MMGYILLVFIITNFVMWNLFFAVVESSLGRELAFNQNMHSTKLFRQRARRISSRPVKPLVGLTGVMATTTFAMKMKRALKRSRLRRKQKLGANESGGQPDAPEDPKALTSPKTFKVAPIRDDGSLESGRQPKSTKKPVRLSQVVPIQDDDSFGTGEGRTRNRSILDEDKTPPIKKSAGSEQTTENDADNDSDMPSRCSVCAKSIKKCCLHGSGSVCASLVTSPNFDIFFMCVIVINIIVIITATYFPRPPCDLAAFSRWQVFPSTQDHIGFTFEYMHGHNRKCFKSIPTPPLHSQNHVLHQSFYIADIVFICIYLVEMVMKMIGLGVVGYFWRSHRERGKRWDGKNTLDAFVCIAIPAVLLFEARIVSPWDPCPDIKGHLGLRGLAELIVILRVARLLRIIRHWEVACACLFLLMPC